METLDHHLTQGDPKEFRPDMYAGFWPRLGAVVVDGLVCSPATAVLLTNMFIWKSIPVFLFCILLTLIYKPFLEFHYGATVGKMAVGIKVVNREMEKPTLQQAIFRSVFHILFSLISLFSSLAMFSVPGFDDQHSFLSYSQFMTAHNDYSFITSYLPGLISLADGIVMVSNDHKRSIHDKIANTYVIRK